jgi:DNA-binding NarL/FixJ family response regulator
LLELALLVVYNANVGRISPVLVVDDDGPLRELVATLLERAGFASREAGSAEEALQQAEEESPSLAILDIDLAGERSGYELFHELRARWSKLPVVFLSGTRGEPFDRVTGLLLGADDYVVKPFHPDELIARIRRLTPKTEPPASELTARQHEVIGLLAGGMTQNEIARSLSLAPRTVASHIESVLRRLNVRSRAEAVAVAHQRGLTNVP